MLDRKIMTQLRAWKLASAKKCLVIRGARQVGKTRSVRELGKEYAHFVEINFIENPDYKRIFTGALDIKSLQLNFSVYLPDASLVPGETLLLLDEIQEWTPDAFFPEGPEVHSGGRIHYDQ